MFRRTLSSSNHWYSEATHPLLQHRTNKPAKHLHSPTMQTRSSAIPLQQIQHGSKSSLGDSQLIEHRGNYSLTLQLARPICLEGTRTAISFRHGNKLFRGLSQTSGSSALTSLGVSLKRSTSTKNQERRD